MMPSYVNIGARVGAGSMVDTWATVGSCAQVGEGVHLSGGVGIGGVLEPPQAAPVMIGDHALIGSRCMITQGARVGAGAVLGEGCILNPGIPVIDAATGEELSGASCRRGAWASAPPGRGPSPGARSACPASWWSAGWRKASAIRPPNWRRCCREHGVSV